jgi:hypothetical protein
MAKIKGKVYDRPVLPPGRIQTTNATQGDKPFPSSPVIKKPAKKIN